MTIENLRLRFKAVRNSLAPDWRQKWESYQAKLLELDTPPTPHEWLQQIQRYLDEQHLEGTLRAWQQFRMEDPHGFGEDIDPITQVKGWSDDLPPARKAGLLRLQFCEDLAMQASYEEWRDSRDW